MDVAPSCLYFAGPFAARAGDYGKHSWRNPRSSGATISGASVTATQIETGLQRKATSDSDGTYVILALPVGHYRVEAEAAGFQTLSRDRITLDVNQTLTSLSALWSAASPTKSK